MTRSGVYQEKEKDSSRIHDMRPRTDVHGHTYESCERYGTMFVSTKEQNK